MFLDAAYASRHKLRQLGYSDPDVVGVFLLPAAERGAKGPAMANAYTSLREMNHFSQPETVFTAEYEERDGQVNDPGPPFSRSFVVPLPPAPRPSVTETVQDSARKAATLLIGQLLSPIGRAAEQARTAPSHVGPTDVTVAAFGQASYVWPRQALLSRSARRLGAAVLSRWTASDPDVIGQYVKGWLAQRWQVEQLGPEFLLPKLQQAGERILGEEPEALFATEAQPFTPKGWFGRDADPTRLWQVLGKLQQMVGMPDERSVQRTVGQVEQKLDEAADAIAREYGPKITRLAITLLEHPDYRLVGAEVAVEQIQGLIDAAIQQYEPLATSLSAQAIDSFHTIHSYLNTDRGRKRPTPTELADALRTYPTWRYQSLVLRQACRIYATFRTQLADQLRELQFCRQRLEDIANRLKRDQSDTLPPSDRILLPPGVDSLEAASVSLESSITKDDLRTFDKKLQSQIEREFNALFNVCLSSVSMLGNLQQTIEDQARSFLADRMSQGAIDEVFFGRFPPPTTAAEAIHRLHDQALPPVKLLGVERVETVVAAGPGGEAGIQLKHLSEYALPQAPAAYVVVQDEVTVYREFPFVPLTALPQLGTIAEDAYTAVLDGQGASPHSRNDVPTWQDVEVG
jgi:hypothetical protein